MFYVAVCDILSMLVVGIVTGVFAIQGVVYCSMPEFNHLMGLFASFFWFAESSASVILAVNRCADLMIPKVNSLFSGGFWSAASVAAPTAFGLYFIVFTKPCFFNGLFACWMYNPHVGYVNDLSNSYENRPHDIHNWSLSVILIGLYITFFVGFGIQQSKHPSLQQCPAWKSRKTLFAQVFVISAVNAIGSSTYDALQLMQVSPAVTIFASFMWLSANGLPGVMYLTMNETIRNGCLELFGFKTAKGARVSDVNFVPMA
ncbi:SRT-29 protein [Aphelenchoides avenae]|nr:SRT-29 protein [Aphelenchus avenae]